MKQLIVERYQGKSFGIEIRKTVRGDATHTQLVIGDIMETVHKDELEELKKSLTNI